MIYCPHCNCEIELSIKSWRVPPEKTGPLPDIKPKQAARCDFGCQNAEVYRDGLCKRHYEASIELPEKPVEHKITGISGKVPNHSLIRKDLRDGDAYMPEAPEFPL